MTVLSKCAALLCALLLWTSCATTSSSPDLSLPETVAGEARLIVFGLSCPLCASNLTDSLNRVEGVEESWGDLDTGAIHVRIAEGKALPSTVLAKAVKDAGFTLQSIETGVKQ